MDLRRRKDSNEGVSGCELSSRSSTNISNTTPKSDKHDSSVTIKSEVTDEINEDSEDEDFVYDLNNDKSEDMVVEVDPLQIDTSEYPEGPNIPPKTGPNQRRRWKPPKVFSCDVCGKIFSRSSKLGMYLLTFNHIKLSINFGSTLDFQKLYWLITQNGIYFVYRTGVGDYI